MHYLSKRTQRTKDHIVMNKKQPLGNSRKSKQEQAAATPGDSQKAAGGELHQMAGGAHPPLTTNQGVSISDNQYSPRANLRGPALLEDFILREKVMHFDRERIPERIVHAHFNGRGRRWLGGHSA